MTYKEFKSTYKWILKQYPDTNSLFCDHFESDYISVLKTEHFRKYKGKWEKVSEMKQDASKMMYMNVFSAVPFFRNIGGFERVEKAYTKYGLIPYIVNSINPDRTEKTVRTFYIK